MREWVMFIAVFAIIVVFVVLLSKMASDVRALKEAIVG